MTGPLAVSRPPDPFEAPGVEILSPPCLWQFDLLGIEFCVTRVMLYMVLASVIVVALFVVAARRSELVPRGVQNLVEVIVQFVREQIALQVIGREGLPWVPFLTSLFVFILVGNIFEVIPGIQFPINSKMAIPAFLAALVWILFVGTGVRNHGLGYFKSVLFPPGVPLPIYLLLTPIEFVSTFVVRPITLSVRLLANMVAGHMILAVFFMGTMYLALSFPFGTVAAIPAFGLSVALVAFEILVSVLQAYIFTILTAVYIAGAIHPEH